MINQRLLDLAAATCFSDQQVAVLFKRELLSKARKRSTFFLDRAIRTQTIRQTLIAALDKDQPRRFRLNDMEQAFVASWPQRMLTDEDIPILSHCFEQLFCYHNNFISYQINQVQDYARFMLKLDPSIVVAWHFACEKRYQSQQLLTRQIEQAKPLFSRLTDLRPYAENHTHLGGMHFDGLVLSAALLDVDRHHDYGDEVASKLKPLFRLLHLLLNDGQNLVNQGFSREQYEEYHNDFIGKIQHTLTLSWQIQLEVKIRLDFIVKPTADNNVSLAWLKAQLIQSFNRGEQIQAWLWLLTWIWRFYRQVNCHFIRTAVIYLISELMVIRRQLIMDGRGLTRFTSFYFNQTLRKNASSYQHRVKDSVAKLLAGPNDVAAIKSTHGLFQPQLIEQLVAAMAKHNNIEVPDSLSQSLSEHQLTQYEKLMERWHWCLHLTRNKSYQHKPEKVWQEVKAIKQKLEQVGQWFIPSLYPQDFRLNRFQPSEKEHTLIPRHWLRGLDVAGDENQLHFEVFAAPLRWLKAQLEQASTEKLHYSIHCGEDYAHPLSGLRKVDETIQFCQLSKDDRLGHGLALGIEPKDWFEHHGDIILDSEEHLDNLVWSYGQAKKLLKWVKSKPQNQLKTIALIERKLAGLKFKIRYLAATVAWALPSDSPDDLYAAWHLRRNCFYQWQHQYRFVANRQEQMLVLPDLIKLQNKHDRASQIYLRRWQHQKGIRLFDQKANAEKSKVLIRLNPLADGCIARLNGELNMYRDDHNGSDVKFMSLLQDHLLEQCRQRSLIIEVNLSSNVAIAHIEDYKDHPIFRWYPVRREKQFKQNINSIRRGFINVCINTDDAGIMPTTLRTEYQLLRQAALQRGEKAVDVEVWLEDLRKFSYQVYKNTHKEVFSATSTKELLGL